MVIVGMGWPSHPFNPFGPNRPLFTLSVARPRTPTTVSPFTPISSPHPLLYLVRARAMAYSHLQIVYQPTQNTGTLDPSVWFRDQIVIHARWPLLFVRCPLSIDVLDRVAIRTSVLSTSFWVGHFLVFRANYNRQYRNGFPSFWQAHA